MNALPPIFVLAVLAIPIGIISMPLFALIHNFYNYRCLRHAQKYCLSHDLKMSRYIVSPAFENRIKTEDSIVEMDCTDAQGKRRYIRMLVWPFGFIKILSDEPFPEEQKPPEQPPA